MPVIIEFGKIYKILEDDSKELIGYVGDYINDDGEFCLSDDYYIVEIGIEAFFRCDSLKKIYIPNTVKKIGGWAFRNCENLENVDISEGLLN